MRFAESWRATRTLLLLVAAVGAMGFRPIRKPLELRVEGYFDNPAEESRAWRVLPVEVGRGSMRRLALIELRVLGSGPLAGSVVDEIKQYKPSLRFTGDAELMAKLTSANPDQRVTVLGHLSASRYFLVASVEVADSSARPMGQPTESPSPRSAPSPSAASR